MSVRVGVIGCGWWSTRAHLPALVANPDATIAAIVDPDEGNRTRAAERFDVPADRAFGDITTMLDEVDPDAVVIAVPHAAHAPVAAAVLERGVHTLLEKPMTIRPADARTLEALARERGAELLIGYPWHYEGRAISMREALREGAIGRIEFVVAHYAALGRELYRGEPEHYRDALGFPLNAPGRGTYSDVAVAGGGQAQTQTTHVVALICWLTGLHPLAVAAMTAAHELEVDLVDALTIRFEDGTLASVGTTGSLLPGHEEAMQMRLYGSAGSALLDLGAGRSEIVRADGSVQAIAPAPGSSRDPEWGPVDNLVDIVLGRRGNESPASIGVMAVDIVDALYRAASSGMTVALGR